LLPVAAGNDTGDLPDFLGELRHIGEFIEIPDPVVLNPLVYGFLGIF
jgi:hypothetical protein